MNVLHTPEEDGKRYVKEFTDIGIQLNAEKDLDKLLNLILTKARQLTVSDGASLYLVDENEGKPSLIFKLAQNASFDLDVEERRLPLSSESLAGYVAITGKPLTIEDAYNLPADLPCRINRSFDEAQNYRSKSMLVLPMTTHRGEVIGVLQLINRKPSREIKLTTPEIAEETVLSYAAQDRERMTALANLAAVAIENNRLYASIRRLFDGFVAASVTAIEQRDPSTKGHSLRVSILTVELAKVVDTFDNGRWSKISFSREMIQELKWAALLHDFGKVGVREKVLVKGMKLYPHQLAMIEQRIAYIRKCIEADILHAKIAAYRSGIEIDEDALNEKERQLNATLDRFHEAIIRSDRPTVLPEGDFQFLKEIQQWRYEDGRMGPLHILDPEEAHILSIRKGSLDEEERLEIESHVTHTYHFLRKIPWTKELRDIPEIAYAHHEKLNGRGYPRGLADEEIPFQSKIMTVADIFDALSAADRPYKKAVPIPKALDILRMEANDGMLDSDLVTLFMESKVWEKTLDLRQVSE